MKFALLIAAFAFAQPAAAMADGCPPEPVVADPWLTWNSPAKVDAGHGVQDAAPIPLARAFDAALHPIAHVRFAAAPGKPLLAKSHGGVFRLNLAWAAHVGIALSGPAWVDVVQGATPVASVAHGHGAPCSGIAKTVWFDLAEGAYTVQLANAPDAAIRIMAADAHNP